MFLNTVEEQLPIFPEPELVVRNVEVVTIHVGDVEGEDVDVSEVAEGWPAIRTHDIDGRVLPRHQFILDA